jgi:hypothetical protein
MEQYPKRKHLLYLQLSVLLDSLPLVLKRVMISDDRDGNLMVHLLTKRNEIEKEATNEKIIANVIDL